MKNIYIFTGYDYKAKKLSTQMKRDINSIFDIVKYYSAEELAKRYKTPKDLSFDVESRRSHEGAVIIQDQNYSWSIFRV